MKGVKGQASPSLVFVWTCTNDGFDVLEFFFFLKSVCAMVFFVEKK